MVSGHSDIFLFWPTLTINLAAQWLDRKSTDEISSTGLRAPETVIYHPWDEKVDIWAVGCLVRI
jgi:hypothetical protein